MTLRLHRFSAIGAAVAVLLTVTACARDPGPVPPKDPPSSEPPIAAREEAFADGEEFGRRLRDAGVNDERTYLRVNGEPVSLGEYQAARVSLVYSAEQRGKRAPAVAIVEQSPITP